MDALELVRSRNRADIELPSGLGATIGLVRIADCIGEVGIPLPVVTKVRELKEQGKSEDEILAAVRSNGGGDDFVSKGVKFREEMVRRTIKRLAPSLAELDGQPEAETPPDVIPELSQEDFDFIAGYALRDTPFPTAGAPT